MVRTSVQPNSIHRLKIIPNRVIPPPFLHRKEEGHDPDSSDSTPIIAGVVSAVVGVALIAFFLKRRRASKQKITHPQAAAPSTHHHGDLTEGLEQPQNVRRTASIATVSTANMSTIDWGEPARVPQKQRAADAAPVAGVKQALKTSSASGRHKSASISAGDAFLAVAREMARSCQVPGVSEVAAAVCIMADLVTDNRENDEAGDSRRQYCRLIVMALKRAADVAEVS